MKIQDSKCEPNPHELKLETCRSQISMMRLVLSTTFVATGLFAQVSQAASVQKMKIVTSPQTVALGTCSKVVTVQAQDSAGRVAPVLVNTKIFFEQGSAELRIFNDASCTTAASTAQILARQNTVSFYFKGTALGTKTLFVSTVKFEDDRQSENITPTGPINPPTPLPLPSPTPVPPATPPPQIPPAFGRTVPAPIYGVTFDDVQNYANQAIELKKFPYMPTARVVLDPGTKPGDYTQAISALGKSAYIMAELQDSMDMKKQTIASFEARAQTYFSALKNSVDIWEVGNEINGDWLGTDVENKLRAGFKVLDNAGATTAITFFWFGELGQKNNCIPANKYEMFSWINNLQQLDLPPAQRDPQNEKMRLNVDYIFISWYPQQCNDIKPDWASVFSRLAEIYPNAKLGFGEIGTANPQNGSAYELNLIQEFYPMAARLAMPKNYVGGYFWWYFAQEMTKPSIVDALHNSIMLGPKP
ncbi:hypothetical protein BH10BDE1_BH10BDE1_13170 [soil metagenome]